MARLRTVKPGFFTNDLLAEIDPLGRLLFIGLWCIADREGRLDDRPRRIKAEVLPYDDADVDELLNALAAHGFIVRYAAPDGNRYIAVCNFTKHQTPHVKEAPSTIPAPCLHSTSTVQAPDEHATSTPSIGEWEPVVGTSSGNHDHVAADAAVSPPVAGDDDAVPPPEKAPAQSQSKGRKPKETLSDDHPAVLLARRLRTRILENLPTAKLPPDTNLGMQSWASVIEIMLRRDGRARDAIEQVIDFAQSDPFWSTNILSANSLRQHYDRLEMQRQRKGQGNHHGANGRHPGQNAGAAASAVSGSDPNKPWNKPAIHW